MKPKTAGLSPYRKLASTIILFAAFIFALWCCYHAVTYRSFERSAAENAELSAMRLLDQVNAEFSQMENAAGIISNSSPVQDFLCADTAEAYFGMASGASEIIRNAVYPNLSASNIITFDTAGRHYRFIGGVSNSACKILKDMINETDVPYTVIELDEVLFFYYSKPIYLFRDRTFTRIGAVVLLTHMDKTRALLGGSDSNIDMSVIQDGVVMISNKEPLEGKAAAELDTMYALISHMPIEGTNLTIAAAMKSEDVYPGITLFLIASFFLLAVMLAAVAILYEYLSGYVMLPMALQAKNAEFEKQKAFVFSLKQQIDAHFVVNAVATINNLIEKEEFEKAGRMTDGLAQIIKSKHTGGELCNLFLEFEIIDLYIEVMNIWHDGKFQVEYDVDDTLAAYLIPGLILQPVIENALTHGLQNKEGEAKLYIRGYMEQNVIILEVCDNGVGIDPKKLSNIREELENADINVLSAPGLSGVALLNIQKRLRLQFGDGYGLSIDSTFGEGTKVKIRIPVVLDEK